MSKKIISISIVLLLIWNIVLTISCFGRHDNKDDTAIEEYRVSGFSTDLTKVADEIKSAVVSVRNGEVLSTGFIYKKENTKIYVLTSYHGVTNSSSFDVVFDSGFRCSASLFGYDPLLDLAVLEMDVDFEVKTINFGDSKNLKTGEFVLSLGNSLDSDNADTAVFAMVGNNYREIENDISVGGERFVYVGNYLQLNGNFVNGFSGAPIVNMAGQIVGMITMSKESFAFAPCANEIKLVADKIIAQETYRKIRLNVFGSFVSEMRNYEIANMNLPLDLVSGYFVTSLKTNGLAYNMGLKSGDVIIEINDQEITNSDDMLKVCYDGQAKTKIKIYRNGEILVFEGEISD